MTDVFRQEGQVRRHQQQQSESWAHQVVKAATAATAGGSLLVLSSLTLAGTVIILTVATPVLVIFSPVLVPAVITMSLLAVGFLISGGFGVAAATVLSWMYRYVIGGHPTGEESLEHVRHRLGHKGGDREEHEPGRGHHATGGVRLTTGARAGLYKI